MEKDKKVRVRGTKFRISNGLCKNYEAILKLAPIFTYHFSLCKPASLTPKCIRKRSHQFIMEDSFGSKQIISQDSSFFMASLVLNSIFINILLKEKIEICTNALNNSFNIIFHRLLNYLRIRIE